MKLFLCQFYRQNLLGFLIGVGLCGFGFALFFFTLGYGASCPSLDSTECPFDLEPMMPVLRGNVILFMSMWAIMFYSGQQILLLSGIVMPENYSESFFATTVMPLMLAIITMYFWGLVGGMIQIGYRKIRK